jgi:hypothetical protein
MYIKFLGILKGVFMLSIVTHLEASVFNAEPLSDTIKKEMLVKKTWNPSCPVPFERLRLVTFSYYDFDGTPHDNGELVVLDAVAKPALEILKTLFERKFPIHKARRIEHYEGDDEASMKDNNSSCFNCREITGGGLPSIHSYGLAIDINPLQNPYVAPHDESTVHQGCAKVLPASGISYLNRTNMRPGMAESIKDLFAENGFTIWGGNWNDPIDWQHFQPSRAVAQLLAVMNFEDAFVFFRMYAQQPKMLNAVDAKQNKLVNFYTQNPIKFMQALEHNRDLLKMEPLEAYEAIEKYIK